AGEIPLGTKLPGVRWVDRRYIKDLDAIGAQSEFGRLIDQTINRPARFAFIYAKPSYVLNKLGNWTMLAITEGHLFPVVMHDARLAEDRLGAGLVAKIDAGVGTTRTGSYVARQSRIGKVDRAVIDWWQRATDQTERRAAFFGEARRAGYRSPQAWRELLESADPEIAAKRLEVFQRARKNIVDFDSLSPAEQKVAQYVFV